MNDEFNTNDPFFGLRRYQQEQNQQPNIDPTSIIFWNYVRDGDILGTIIDFDSFTHPQYGVQHTVVVRLADSNKLVSAFLNGWLQEGMKRQHAAVGDLVLIQFFGKPSGELYNRFHLVIEKPRSVEKTFSDRYQGRS